MEFSRQEYLSALPSPPSGSLPDPGIKPPLCHTTGTIQSVGGCGEEGKQGGPSRRTASSTTPVSVRSGHCNKSAADWTAQQQTSISRSLEARKSRIQEQAPNVWRCPQTAKREAISSLRGALISFVGAHSHDPSPADDPASSITRLGI